MKRTFFILAMVSALTLAVGATTSLASSGSSRTDRGVAKHKTTKKPPKVCAHQNREYRLTIPTYRCRGVDVDFQPAEVFLPAGAVGGGVLPVGAEYPPTDGSISIMKRGANRVSYQLVTTGLPPGAYTNWWAIFNNPESCQGDEGCDLPDLLEPDVNASVFWADGKVVRKNGVGYFRSSIREGQVPKGEGKLVLGPGGLVDSKKAEIHIVVKYHGPASKDPEVLREQTGSLLGSCFEGANAIDFGDPFGVQCFDPQAVIHKP